VKEVEEGPRRLLVRRIAAIAAHYCGGLRLYRGFMLRDSALVLMYHRVVSDASKAKSLEPGMYVTAATFEKQIRVLAEQYTLQTMDGIGEWLSGTFLGSRPVCAITFDDGWRDNYDVAFPILERFHAPATVFLITGSIGASPMMDWSQAREMEQAGISFGSHTVSHLCLGTADEPTIRRELALSREHITEQLVQPSGWFCYPKGSRSDLARSIVPDYYRGAVVTQHGTTRRGDDPFEIRRIGIHDDMTSTNAMFAWRRSGLR
jgi:peptidoglycan/xylan/chitin deacetylase (PgdA/CDA1 family)